MPALAAALLAVTMACSGTPSSPSPGTGGSGTGGGNPGPGTGTGTGGGGVGPTGATVSAVAVGDIGWCRSPGTPATAALTAGLDGQVILAGDIAYLQGTAQNFRECFDPWWGQFRSRWRPVPGNHEYETPGAAGYFQYFGTAANPEGQGGYYSFMTGDWLILMIDSNVPATRGSPQYEYARRILELQRTPCTMAVWHHPLFSSGVNGSAAFMRDMWSLLEASSVEVVVNGHDHIYERFARQMSDGRPDPVRGIRQFTVGTGGAELTHIVRVAENSESRITQQYGVMHFTLQPAAMRWEFVTVNRVIADAGLDTCR